MLDPTSHGYQAKIHADAETIEYTGRASHDLDIVCVRLKNRVHERNKYNEEDNTVDTTDLNAFYVEILVLSNAKVSIPSFPHKRPSSWRRRMYQMKIQDQVQSQISSPNNVEEFESYTDLATCAKSFRSHELHSKDRKRLSHRISVGFVLSSETPQEHLGVNPSTIGFRGKSGGLFVKSESLDLDARYGVGDVIGCGVLLDSRTIFLTMNGELLAELEYDEYLTEEMDYSEMCAAVSLHGPGECVRLSFDEKNFEFDLKKYLIHVKQHRQCALAVEHPDADGILDKIVEDFLLTYGYKNTYDKLIESRDLALASVESHEVSSAQVDMADVEFRSKIRALFYQSRTKDAIEEIRYKYPIFEDENILLFYCSLLCCMDVLVKKEEITCTAKVLEDGKNLVKPFFEKIFHDQEISSTEKTAILDNLRALTSLFFCTNLAEATSSSQRLTSFDFREKISDDVNAWLINQPSKVSSPNNTAGSGSSLLEKLLHQHSALVKECIDNGCSIFPRLGGALRKRGKRPFGLMSDDSENSARRRRRRSESMISSLSSSSTAESDME